MEALSEPRVTLVHDWLTGMRGGEKCLEALCERWPDAPLLTLLHVRGSVSATIEERVIDSTPLGYLPGVKHYYRYLLPLMPWAASKLRVPICDLLLSLSHCVAKSVPAPAGVPHICYCLTPMRYAWHLREAYFRENRLGKLKTALIDVVLEKLRAWDRRTAENVTHFVAISHTVKERIRECYGRDSAVIYPPVDTEFFCPDSGSRQEYYLVVSAFAPYKRLDLAIQACKRLGRPLVLIGSGPEERRLRGMASGQATFLGRQPDEVVRQHLRRCRALLFPGEEDFGIVPVEAMACGTPVIAYGRGGACETVIPAPESHQRDSRSLEEPTGLWFEHQTTECLAAAMARFETDAGNFSPAAARRQALRFNKNRFKREFFGLVASVLETKQPIEKRAA
jgi:glycosyltransferase involved in cell wall biosynthesis